MACSQLHPYSVCCTPNGLRHYLHLIPNVIRVMLDLTSLRLLVTEARPRKYIQILYHCTQLRVRSVSPTTKTSWSPSDLKFISFNLILESSALCHQKAKPSRIHTPHRLCGTDRSLDEDAVNDVTVAGLTKQPGNELVLDALRALTHTVSVSNGTCSTCCDTAQSLR